MAVEVGTQVARARVRTAWLFLAPLTAVLAAGYLWPLGQAFVNSFHPNTQQGVDAAHWTAANYAALLNPLYGTILARTLRISLVVTAITALLAYPVAIFTARLDSKAQAWVILAYVSPWLVNTVVKSFGWSLLLRSNGVINTALKGLGLIDTPLKIMLNETGIIIALIPGHFMFVLLPLWAAVSGLDPALLWAAGTLGARPWQIFLRVILPLTLPSLIAGLTINFTMNMTAFAAPAILGGTRAEVVSYLAFQVNLVQLNWPLGGALAIGLLAFILALVWGGQHAAGLALRRGVPLR
ncbi:MAG: ABC transporter permease [Alphaproteobacteria bacterium]